MKLKTNKVYLFIILYIILELFLTLASHFYASKSFALTPYFRTVLILFTIIYFSFDLLKIKVPTRFSRLFTINEIFVYGWSFFAVFSVFIGIINENPILYIVTDALYVLIGCAVFLIFKNSKAYENLQFIDISKILIVLGLISIAFSIKAPAILMVITLILIYINILKKKYFFCLILLIPYLIMVISSNRAQLIVLFLMIFLLLLKKIRRHFTLIFVLFFGLCSIFSFFYFKVEILQTLLFFFNINSNLGMRIHQVIVVFTDGIDYSNIFFLSISQRIIEVTVVVDYWTSNLSTFLFGSGSGGVINGSKFFSDNAVLNASLLGDQKVHNIHVLPFSLIFRYGLVGLMFFLILCTIVYRSIIKILNEEVKDQELFWNLFLVLWFFFSIPAASFLWSMPLFWISLVFTNYRQHKSHPIEKFKI
jgi:hypothetical protein